MIVKILTVAFEIFVYMYFFADVICAVRNNKYQKIWYREKATRVRIDPNISNAELCEQYVMFCKRNGCKVEF